MCTIRSIFFVSVTLRTISFFAAHRLEVVCFYGDSGEEMSLPIPIAPIKPVEKWFHAIELAMKSLMWNKMAQCVEERLLCTPSITKLLSGLGMN